MDTKKTAIILCYNPHAASHSEVQTDLVKRLNEMARAWHNWHLHHQSFEECNITECLRNRLVLVEVKDADDPFDGIEVVAAETRETEGDDYEDIIGPLRNEIRGAKFLIDYV